MRGRMLWIGALLLLIGCAGQPPRFTTGDAVVAVDDRADIEMPQENEFYRLHHHFQNFFDRRLRNGLDPMPPHPSEDVNRFGEVVDSSWYTNRTSALTPEEVYRGAGGRRDSPEAHFPWTITRVKVGGRNPGFLFEDASGERFLLKVDKVGVPTIATAAGAVANRLFWALGYNTPDDRVVVFDREKLLLSQKARAAGITEATVDHVLEGWGTKLADGRWRALVSRFLAGRPLGGFSYRGTRSDDPNDRVAHERRRSLRGLRVFAAWLQHVDTKIDNTLDLYTERDGRRFVEHYFVDFDGCLGGYWAARHEERIGWAYDLDLGQMFSSIPELGLDRRPYEGAEVEIHPEVGLFEADVYDPKAWRSNYVNDQILSATAADVYWAGTILAQIDRTHMHAAVRTARFADPAASELLESVLYERWRKTVDWALRKVTPVASLQAQAIASGGFRVQATDALVDAGLGSELEYRVRLLDARLDALPDFLHVGTGPEVEIGASSLRGVDYCVLEWVAEDAKGNQLPTTQAHYARATNNTEWRLVGILRDGQ